MSQYMQFPAELEIETIVDDLGSVYVGEPIVTATAGDIDDRDAWTFGVSIRGAWNGEVVLSGSRAFAVQAASDLLGIEPCDVSDEDARDGVSEVANVIGGNLKALISAAVGQTCRMTPPCAMSSGGSFPDRAERQRLWFSWRRHRFCVRVVDSSTSGGGGLAS